jgi:hypothetical protein
LAIDAQSQWRCTSSSGSLSRAACAAAALELAGTHATRNEADAAAEAAAWFLAKFASRGLVEPAAAEAAIVEAATVEAAAAEAAAVEAAAWLLARFASRGLVEAAAVEAAADGAAAFEAAAN